MPGWDAAGLLLLLGGAALPTVCARALETPPARKGVGGKDGSLRPAAPGPAPGLQARSARPFALAGGMFGLACLLGGLSPFAAPVYAVAGKLALAGAVSRWSGAWASAGC